MELKTISQVSQGYNISTRTLRYYEQLGLLDSRRVDGYSYRVYDDLTISKLREIIFLRKLRIPLKQISGILKRRDAKLAIDVFRQSIAELNTEIEALSSIRGVLSELIMRLDADAGIPVCIDMFDDEAILDVVDSLTLTTINFKEEKSVDNISEKQPKLKDVRIVYLPPATVAASHYIGDEPEYNAGKVLDEFVKKSNLVRTKPDLRHFGFNHPNPVDETGAHGYEMWVTIPDDMEVPAPLEKKRFGGGLYAAHMITMGNFHEWEWLLDWANNNPDYIPDMQNDGGECMYGLLEEHLNYINHVQLENTEPAGMQLDLLMPVKAKK